MNDSGIIPYVVQIDPLRKFFGSMNVPELEKIKSANKTYITEQDEIFRWLIDGGAPPLNQALDHICAGDIRRPQFASQYAYALELLCAHFGQPQPNQHTNPIDADWFISSMEQVLRAWGLGTVLHAEAILRGVWPLPIPRNNSKEPPTGGTIMPDEIEHAIMAMRNGSIPGNLDPRAIPMLGELRGWFEAAAAARGALVCFYY
jgi:hypothetical protein